MQVEGDEPLDALVRHPGALHGVLHGRDVRDGQVWGIAGVLAALIADICILIWLCMSSDTNGVGATEFAPRTELS